MGQKCSNEQVAKTVLLVQMKSSELPDSPVSRLDLSKIAQQMLWMGPQI